MLIENFQVNGLYFAYGKVELQDAFVAEGVTSNGDFVRLRLQVHELQSYHAKTSVVSETPTKVFESAAQALASATPVATPASATMSDTLPVKRGRGRPRKVQS